MDKKKEGRLCLTRYEQQSVFIGDDIEVKVVSIKGSQVKLLFVAPLDYKIYRGELAYDDSAQVPCEDNGSGRPKIRLKKRKFEIPRP